MPGISDADASNVIYWYGYDPTEIGGSTNYVQIGVSANTSTIPGTNWQGPSVTRPVIGSKISLQCTRNQTRSLETITKDVYNNDGTMSITSVYAYFPNTPSMRTNASCYFQGTFLDGGSSTGDYMSAWVRIYGLFGHD